ncbi:MAG TPA: L,D-transpeptidase family protein [Candidatus Angelobacter sp.]|nr:L,D-transpeptidase family protein [Candidatus Angelobacter sp.]
MKSIPILALLICTTVSSPSYARHKDPLRSSTEIVVVTTANWNSPQGVLRRYERSKANKKWQAAGESIAVMVGKSGLAWGSGIVHVDALISSTSDPVKKEGDSRAPAGVFRLSKVFGYAPQAQPEWKMPYLGLTSSVECVDDTASKFYNHVVDRSTVSPDWNSSEHMLRSDDLYRWGILVDHNAAPPLAGEGSCIFMHIWRGPSQPTVGCTAMPQTDLESLIAWLDPALTPLLVQLPEAQYKNLRKRWHLPPMSRDAAPKK